MAKFFASFYLLLVLLVFTSVRTIVPGVNGKECRLATINGGCPNEDECWRTCETCYRNVGTVKSYCQAGGGGLPYMECFCVMSHGAPCSPIGEPKCPNWPRPPASSIGNNATV